MLLECDDYDVSSSNKLPIIDGLILNMFWVFCGVKYAVVEMVVIAIILLNSDLIIMEWLGIPRAIVDDKQHQKVKEIENIWYFNILSLHFIPFHIVFIFYY